MSESNLDRVREDLAAMRQALGLRPPFEREYVWLSLSLGLVGIAIAALTAWTDISARPATPGSTAHWAYIALIVTPVFLVLAVMSVIARRRKGEAPLAWRDLRVSWVVAAIALPLYLGFISWAGRTGLSAAALTAATLFLAGLFSLMAAIPDRSRWYTLGWAVSTLLAGVCAPVASYENAGLVVGGWLFLGGFSTAAIMARQLRSGDYASDRL
jgi:hypothetical protein